MATWSEADKALVRELNEELGTLRERAPPILDTILPRLRDGLDVELGMACGARLENAGTSLEFASLSGFAAPQRMLSDDLDGWFRGSPGRFSLYNPVRPEPFQRNKALWVGSFEQLSQVGRGPMIDASMLGLEEGERDRTLENLRKGRQFYERGKVVHHQQLRVLICDGPALLAWVGVLQEGPFSARQQRVFAALVPALQRRLSLDQRLSRSELHEAGFLAALEALPTAAFLLNANGTLLQANALGRASREKDRRRLEEELSVSLRGGVRSPPFQITPLALRGAPWFLAVQRAPPRDAAEIVCRADVRYGLTRRQSDVLHGLLKGYSNKRIARELDCAERTVEVHVTALLEKTGCESRAELVARVWRELG